MAVCHATSFRRSSGTGSKTSKGSPVCLNLYKLTAFTVGVGGISHHDPATLKAAMIRKPEYYASDDKSPKLVLIVFRYYGGRRARIGRRPRSMPFVNRAVRICTPLKRGLSRETNPQRPLDLMHLCPRELIAHSAACSSSACSGAR